MLESQPSVTSFYVHDSVAHVRKDHIDWPMFSNRDLGSKFHAAVFGSGYRFDNLLLQFFGTRAIGVGYFSPGELLFGIGRHNVYDDSKGLNEGT